MSYQHITELPRCFQGKTASISLCFCLIIDDFNISLRNIASDLAEDKLQPELKASEEKAVSLDSSETELAEVEAGDVQRSTTDEQVVCLGDVGVTAAVETT